MAQVFRATDTQLDRDVAVKLVDLRTDLDGDARNRVAREARRAARLRHPNVVQIHDAGTDDGHAYIVMEHITGPTLTEVLDKDGPLEQHRVAEIGVHVCRALSAAHRAGIVHRDVKPGNILIDGEHVKITDFGIARAASDTVTDEQLRGTASYLAPEQLNDTEVDRRADLYALGIVLYELATGARPFDGATATETAMRRLHADPPAPSDSANVSPQFDEVVGRALARDPRDRFQTADEMRVALEPLTADPTVDTQPLEVLGGSAAAEPDEAEQGGRRRRWGVAVLALVLLAALGFLLGPRLLSSPSAQVPDLGGSTVGAAATILDQHGLEIGTVTRRPSDRPVGTVIGQDPAAGTTVPPAGTVDLTLAERPAPPSSPSPSPDGATEGDGSQQPATDGDDSGAVDPENAPEPPDGRGPDGGGPPGQDGPPGRD